MTVPARLSCPRTRPSKGYAAGCARTSVPPMTQLCTAALMATWPGSTARISAVGASKHGFTSTNQSSPGNASRCRSSGLQLLHGVPVSGSGQGRAAARLSCRLCRRSAQRGQPGARHDARDTVHRPYATGRRAGCPPAMPHSRRPRSLRCWCDAACAARTPAVRHCRRATRRLVALLHQVDVRCGVSGVMPCTRLPALRGTPAQPAA